MNLNVSEPTLKTSINLSPRREAKWMALAVGVFGLALGLWLIYARGYGQGDAISRVANAYYVFFSNDPHLADVGFIWNPLPTLFDLPLVLMHPVFPQMVSRGIAGVVESAFMAAIGIYYLIQIQADFGISRGWRIAFASVYSLNPLILLFSANGMTDVMLMSTYIAAFTGIYRFIRTNSIGALMSAAVWIVIGFGVRYEAIPFALFAAIGLAVGLWGATHQGKVLGILILLLTPLAYAGGLWVYFNWLIMKNPLYFLDSPYSARGQLATGAGLSAVLIRIKHHPLLVLLHAAHMTLLFWPFGLGVLLTVPFLFGHRRDPMAPVLIGGAIGTVTIEIIFIYGAKLAAWDRYFMSYIPMGYLFLLFVFAKYIQYKSTARRRLLLTVLLALAIGGNVGTWFALQTPLMGTPDGYAIKAIVHDWSMPRSSTPANDPSVVAYLNAHPRQKILADVFEDYSIVIRANNLKNFVITPDQDFQAVLHNPRGQVNAFLVPQPKGDGTLDAINRAYPGLYYGKVPWARLEKTFHGGANWKLYTILPSAP